MLSPRGAYITLLKTKRNPSIEKSRQIYIGRNSVKKTKHNPKQGNDDRRYRSNPKTDRQKTFVMNGLNRQSTTRLETKLTRRQSKASSKMNSWSKTCITLKNRESNHEEEMRKNKQGQNCRIVVMQHGKAQQEHFIKVDNLCDVRNFLSKTFPNANYFLTIPRQISLEYMLTKENIPGSFLNGQSLYIKPVIEVLERKETVSISDFQILKQVGSGGFSKVFLVRYKRDNQFYAMKLIEKEMILKNKKKRIVMNERNIMVNSKHPFVVELKHAFETNKYIVFIMEYCAGGELFGLIKKFRRLSEDVARFYIIQIFLGLAYLHTQNVVYRDIKPQNILLGIDGHAKIADLGLAKPDMTKGELAYSFCGSPEYMSPQMIMQVGHTYPVDYYCMGALLYELLTGLPPFYSQDPNEIYQAVLVEEVTFPDDVQLSQECRSLLKALLCKDPKHRLGSLYGTKEILAHPWFGKQTYQRYIDKSVEPPVNFKDLEKIGLDLENDKHKESLEKVLKEQKSSAPFKQIMKNFYHSVDSGKERKQRPLSSRRSSRQNLRSASKKVNESEAPRKGKKKLSYGVMVRTPLQAMIQN